MSNNIIPVYQLHCTINNLGNLLFYFIYMKQPFSTQVLLSSSREKPQFLFINKQFVNSFDVYINNNKDHKGNVEELYTHTSYIINSDKDFNNESLIEDEIKNCRQILKINGILIEDVTFYHDKKIQKSLNRNSSVRELSISSREEKKRICWCI